MNLKNVLFLSAIMVTSAIIVYADNKNGTESELIEVCKNGDLAKVQGLIKSGANLNFRNSDGFTSLMFATINGDIELVKLLVRAYSFDHSYKLAKATLNAQNSKGKTALMYACEEGQTEIVRLLVDRGAKFSIENYSGQTALELAKNEETREIIKQAMEKKVNSYKLGIDLVHSIIHEFNINNPIDHEKLVKILNIIDAGAKFSLKHYFICESFPPQIYFNK